jgi:hypothetical protein
MKMGLFFMLPGTCDVVLPYAALVQQNGVRSCIVHFVFKPYIGKIFGYPTFCRCIASGINNIPAPQLNRMSLVGRATAF